jgi:hypothetical protein
MVGTKWFKNQKNVIWRGNQKTETYFIGYRSPGSIGKFMANTRRGPVGREGKEGYEPATPGWDKGWVNDELVARQKRDVPK